MQGETESERSYLKQQLVRVKKRAHATDVLRMIALDLNPCSELQDLPKQTVSKLLHYLTDTGQIRKEGGNIYSISDPMLSLLLLND